MKNNVPKPEEIYDPDSPIRVKGLFTDPIRSGFQILHNYESTYWRALVGNDAWSLYEVLRSFCHTSKQEDPKEASCWPSINLLASILGLKERRVITGYAKTVKGKRYVYEGLIEVLQKYDLIIAREVGEGSEMRYEFDVILTPKQLSPEQIETLPFILRTKHEELLERCKKNLEKLQANRRPPRVSENGDNSGKEKGSGDDENRGSVNYRGGAVNYRGGFGNLPTEQQQENNTQLTLATGTVNDHNNNSSENLTQSKTDVVVALTKLGITQSVATRLSGRYSRKRIFEKIEYRDWLVEKAPDKIKKPGGWLRRAIEDNYAAPDGFVTKEDLERKEAEKVQAAKLADEQTQKNALERERLEAEKLQAEITRLEKFRARYKTTAEDIEVGESLKQTLKLQNFNSIILNSLELLGRKDGKAIIGLENDFLITQASHPNLIHVIKRELKKLTKTELDLEYVVFQDE